MEVIIARRKRSYRRCEAFTAAGGKVAPVVCAVCVARFGADVCVCCSNRHASIAGRVCRNCSMKRVRNTQAESARLVCTDHILIRLVWQPELLRQVRRPVYRRQGARPLVLAMWHWIRRVQVLQHEVLVDRHTHELTNVAAMSSTCLSVCLSIDRTTLIINQLVLSTIMPSMLRSTPFWYYYHLILHLSRSQRCIC